MRTTNGMSPERLALEDLGAQTGQAGAGGRLQEVHRLQAGLGHLHQERVLLVGRLPVEGEQPVHLLVVLDCLVDVLGRLLVVLLVFVGGCRLRVLALLLLKIGGLGGWLLTGGEERGRDQTGGQQGGGRGGSGRTGGGHGGTFLERREWGEWERPGLEKRAACRHYTADRVENGWIWPLQGRTMTRTG
jgi:hypothetical protein